jgi:hypothetical protein
VIDWLGNGLVYHNLKRPAKLIEVETVLDVGAGVRPFGWYQPRQHICVEPCAAYRTRLLKTGLEVIGTTAEQALSFLKPGAMGAIYMLDVIEHMERAVGLRCIELALMAQPRQIVVYTPLGFLEQDGPDPWGLGGELWQRHRSGWTPADFQADWSIEYHANSFFAIWTNPRESILAV